MHEMGVAMQVVEITLASIPPEMPRAQVARVNLKIGKLSAVVVDSLRFCFDIAKKDTALARAELIVEEIPVTARCTACGHDWTIDAPVFSCPNCQSGQIEMLSGRELDIDTIELYDEDN